MTKSISDIMYQFIWNVKLDNVNRQQICKDYLDRGFSMFDFEKVIKSVKLIKIRHLKRDSDSPWAYLFDHQLNLLNKLFTYGPVWC